MRATGRLLHPPSQQQWDKTHTVNRGGTQVQVGGHINLGEGVVLHCSLVRSPMATIELSVPRLNVGHNLNAATLDETLAVLHDFYLLAENVVAWATPFDLMEIMRLDLVLDFTSPSAKATTALLDGLRDMKVLYGPPTDAYRAGRHSTSLRRGSGGRWVATLYRKDTELLAKASRTRDSYAKDRLLSLADEATGQVRCEVGLRAPVLRERNIHTLADLTPEVLRDLHHEFFRRARFDAVVSSSSRWVDIYMAVDDDTRRDLVTVFGIKLVESRGLPVAKNEKTVARYKRIADQHGITTADFATNTTSITCWLDYEQALLITQDAV